MSDGNTVGRAKTDGANALKGAQGACDATKGAFSASHALKAPFSTPPATAERLPIKDPMKSFRGVMAGALIMEGITVALSLPVIARFDGGIGTTKGWMLIAISVLLVLLCGTLKRSWTVPVVLLLQVALAAFFFVSLAVSVIGLLFLVIWLWLLWLRRDVTKRMAEGRLPSQQVPRS
jgi:hypothetical protein